VWPTIRVRPSSSARATTALPSVTVVVSGFSTRTCLPARRQVSVTAACDGRGRRDDRCVDARKRQRLVEARPHLDAGELPLDRSSRSAFASQTTTTWASGNDWNSRT
jgi:hypothetical protein